MGHIMSLNTLLRMLGVLQSTARRWTKHPYIEPVYFIGCLSFLALGSGSSPFRTAGATVSYLEELPGTIFEFTNPSG